jgi:alkylation response protein AidB-like acyl-CoA dehydrogenase
MTTQELLNAVENICPILIADADKAEAQRMPTAAMCQAMYSAGLYSMLAPRRYGGLEMHPTECMTVWEAVARIDSGAAWNLVMNQGIANYAAWLPEAGVKELFANGIPTIAGALNPPARAHRVEGGWRVTGQVPFGSGCHHAQWLAMPAMEEGATAPFAVFFRREVGTILDTWHTMGMRGTDWVHGLPGGRRFCAGSIDRADRAIDEPGSRIRWPNISYVALAEYPRRGRDLRRYWVVGHQCGCRAL